MERSQRSAKDFYARYMAIYMAAASGIVDILTNWGAPEPEPHDCDYYYEMIRLLKLNKKVIAIFAVNIQDWQDSTLIWV